MAYVFVKDEPAVPAADPRAVCTVEATAPLDDGAAVSEIESEGSLAGLETPALQREAARALEASLRLPSPHPGAAELADEASSGRAQTR